MLLLPMRRPLPLWLRGSKFYPEWLKSKKHSDYSWPQYNQYNNEKGEKMKQILCIILAMLLLLLTGGTTLAEEMAGKWGVDFLGYGSDNCLPESFIYWFNDVWALGGAFGFRFDGRPDDSGYFLGASVLKVLKEYEGVRWETKLGVYYDKEFFYSGDDYYVKAYEKIILGAGVGVECFIGSKHSINGFLEYTGAQKISTYSDGSITNNFDAGIQYSVFLRWYK